MDERTFDCSSLRTYMSCPRKYYWKYVRHLQLKDDDSPALDFGTAVHQALEVWYNTGEEEEMLETFHEFWDERFSDKKRTHEKGEKLLTSYVEKYDSEPFEIIGEPEQVFELELFNTIFVGKMDLVIRYPDQFDMILDHKTSTRMGRNYFKSFNPDIQMTGYTIAGRAIYPELDIKGAIVNVLYFTMRKMDFFREMFLQQDWEIDRWFELYRELTREIMERPRDDYKAWRINDSYCIRWGECPYRDLCTVEEPDKMFYLYEKDVWDPRKAFDAEHLKKRSLEKLEERNRINYLDF